MSSLSAPPKYPILQGSIFFSIFFVVAVLCEIALLFAFSAMFHSTLIPRGLGWIVTPFCAGFAGWAFGREIGVENALEKVGIKLLDFSNGSFRIWIVSSGLWLVFITMVFLIFDPFGRYRLAYWREEEWMKFVFIFIAPPILGLLGIHLFDWALKARVIGHIPESQRYEPSEAAYKNILWGLIAVSVINGEVDTRRLEWIEMLHEKLRGAKINRDALLGMANRIKFDGTNRINGVLLKNRDQMAKKDREFLVKSSCVLASTVGPMTVKDRELILEFVSIYEISEVEFARL